MSSRRKTLYGVLAAMALIALLGDRFLSADRRMSRADAATVAVGAVGAPGHGATGVSRGAVVAVTPFPRRLPPLGRLDQVRDPFDIPGRVVEMLLSRDCEGDDCSGNLYRGRDTATTAARFAREHTLTATLVDESTQVAVVDDAWVTAGGRVDACVLVKVAGQSATFQCADGPVTLEVNTVHTDQR